MLLFNKEGFEKALCTAPEIDAQTVFSEAEYSLYVHDLLRACEKEEMIDLSTVDWDMFEIEHVTPEYYERTRRQTCNGWIMGFIRCCKGVPAFQKRERSFF